MKVGTHVTLRLSTKDQRLMAELMAFWNRSDKGVLKLAFDQLVLATQQIQQRLIDEENRNEEATTNDGIWNGTAGPVESYVECSDEPGDDGLAVTESDADGAVSASGPADGPIEAEEQRGAE